MNLLLLEPTDLDSAGHARVSDPLRLSALHRLDLKPGNRIRAGLLNGNMGLATAIHVTESMIHFRLDLQEAPPKAAPIDLILALPRPKMLRRILRTISECGVKRLWLINSYRVDKSYWQSPLLQRDLLKPFLLDGLTQVRDTVVPEVYIEPRFKPFVEDRLALHCEGRRRLLADPRAALPCPRELNAPCTLAIGPEGGFTDYERGALENNGFQAVSLGSRILRVETAVTFLLGRLI